MKAGDKAYLIESGRVVEVELVAEVPGGFLVRNGESGRVVGRSELVEVYEEDGWYE